MHWQVVNTSCGGDDSLLVGAGAPFIQESLGRRAATLSSSTELIYIFFAVGSMRLLPASGLLSLPFAPARVLTRPPVVALLSPLSPGAARRRGGRRVVEAGALEHVPAEGHRTVRAALPGRKIRRLRRAESDRGGRRVMLLAPSCGFMCSCNRCNVYVTVAVTRVERVRWRQNFFIAYSCRSRRADFGCQIRFESFDHL